MIFRAKSPIRTALLSLDNNIDKEHHTRRRRGFLYTQRDEKNPPKNRGENRRSADLKKRHLFRPFYRLRVPRSPRSRARPLYTRFGCPPRTEELAKEAKLEGCDPKIDDAVVVNTRTRVTGICGVAFRSRIFRVIVSRRRRRRLTIWISICERNSYIIMTSSRTYEL